MRSRNIKPGFFKEEGLADAGPTAQILFAGLWCLADKSGLLKDIPRLIKAEVFPYYDVDVNGELTVIQRLGYIQRYKVDGISIIKIVNFQKHQNPHHTEKPSTLHFLTDEEYISYCKQKEKEVNGELTVKSRLSHGEYPADSLIPDSLIQYAAADARARASASEEKNCVVATVEKRIELQRYDDGKNSDPKTPEEWQSYFVNVKLFSFAEARTSGDWMMYRKWVEQGVTRDDVEMATLDIDSKGKRAIYPTYYDGFVQDVLARKNRLDLHHVKHNGSKRQVKTGYGLNNDMTREQFLSMDF